MKRDADVMRQGGLTIFSQAKHGVGVKEIATCILQACSKATSGASWLDTHSTLELLWQCSSIVVTISFKQCCLITLLGLSLVYHLFLPVLLCILGASVQYVNCKCTDWSIQNKYFVINNYLIIIPYVTESVVVALDYRIKIIIVKVSSIMSYGGLKGQDTRWLAGNGS